MRIYTPKQYKARLRRLEREIKSGSGRVLQKVSRWGAWKAKSIAPWQSGVLHNNIFWKSTKNHQAWITQRNPGKQNPNNQGLPYNYAEAMRRNNTLGNTWLRNRIKSGNPDYMEVAAQATRLKFKKDVRSHVVKAIKVTK